ncbi:MAG: alpha/beta hydrolase [Victivallaceae bacterium]|nr:alpha/beta hydrolase [Victivallaceae bacterium]
MNSKELEGFVFTSIYLDREIVPGRVMDVFEPEAPLRDTVIFFIHGGGWRAGSRTAHHVIMAELAKRGYMSASTDYRLDAPGALEQLADVRESYDRLTSFLKQRNRPLKIAVYGGSAGAHLASLLLCAEPGECGEKAKLVNDWVKPVCGMLQATPVDLLPWDGMMPQTWKLYRSAANADYEQCPERYEKLSLRNYIRPENPRLFFLEAGLEHLFLPKHTRVIAERHREWGIPSQWKLYPLMEHGFFYALQRERQREAFEDVCAFVEGNLNLPL